MQAKAKPKLSGLAKTFQNVLSATSSNHAEPQLVREEEVASCSGNWLSHLDWNGVRYLLGAGYICGGLHPLSHPCPYALGDMLTTAQAVDTGRGKCRPVANS